jgi:hypothetical protein
MRFLNKITFINSATIKYAEVSIDGNVHFIGTQGVGKSTLLRAILFFYNADTLKLGISKEKKSFAEYYFPYQNSYLIYEVVTETGSYSIIAFKSQGKVCFRFTDTPYNRNYFIADDGKAYESWDQTRALLDKDKVFYSRKIDRYEEYRDILYGNNESKKEFRKYALLESKQYQNIPRTIQNVFLNSKLEAEFIKQTIIMSLNEEDIEIDLQSYTHHLKDFEAQLNDINLFRQPYVLKQAEQVINFHTAVKHLEKEKVKLALQLAHSIYHVQRNEPKINERLEREQTNRNALVQRIEESNKRFQSKVLKLQAEVSVLDDKLKTIKEKKDYYEKREIDKLTIRVAKKSDLEVAQEKLRKEQDVLKSQFKDVTQKYDLLLQQLESSYKDFEQSRHNQRLDLKESMLSFKQDAKDQLDKLLADIRQNHKHAIEQGNAEIEQKMMAVQQVRIKRETLRHQRFFEEEIVEAAAQINEYQLAIQRSANEISTLKTKQETWQKQWELEEAALKKNTERENEKINETISQLQRDIISIEDKIINSKDSFYGWLNENQKGWENNIGKVCDEEVLFLKDLAPKKVENAGFYGVDLNLLDVEKKVKTVAQYDKEKKKLAGRVEELNQRITVLQQDLNKELDKLKKKFGPRIRETKESLTEQEYIADQSKMKLDQSRLMKKDYELKAETEKKEALQQMEVQIDAATDAHLSAKQALQAIEETLQKQIRSKEKEYEKKIRAEEDIHNASLKQINEELVAYKVDYTQQKDVLLQQQKEELGGKGADTTKLSAIEKSLKEIGFELTFIEKNRDTVAEYKKDKRELLDKADTFRNEKQVLEQKVDNDEQKQKQHIQSFRDEIKLVEDNIDVQKHELQKAREDIQTFNDFQVTDAYKSIPLAHRELRDEGKSDKRTKWLVEEITRTYYNSIKRLDELKESVNKFIGNFSPNNIFRFNTTLVANQLYLDFAQQLNEFVNDNKVEEFEKRTNEKFASVIHLLGKETTHLMSKGDEIQKIITSINKDFDRKNFVGAIKKIELRLDESANRIVHLLLQIKKFNDENAYDIGGFNLFTSVDSETKNKKAVDLLKQLSKSISEYKKDYISLSDSFELKFRIEENQNDTGWVEKLANVGSEGTDVLVKAMINIMLLNVFKEGASKRFKEFRLHCMMDEIGKLHPNNVKGILQFANDRNILLINGSPVETNAMDYRHIFKLEKDAKSFTKVKRIISNYS